MKIENNMLVIPAVVLGGKLFPEVRINLEQYGPNMEEIGRAALGISTSYRALGDDSNITLDTLLSHRTSLSINFLSEGIKASYPEFNNEIEFLESLGFKLASDIFRMQKCWISSIYGSIEAYLNHYVEIEGKKLHLYDLVYTADGPGRIKNIYTSKSSPNSLVELKYIADNKGSEILEIDEVFSEPLLIIQGKRVKPGDVVFVKTSSEYWKAEEVSSMSISGYDVVGIYTTCGKCISKLSLLAEIPASIEGVQLKARDIVYYKFARDKTDPTPRWVIGFYLENGSCESILVSQFPHFEVGDQVSTTYLTSIKCLTRVPPKRKIKIGNVEIDAPEKKAPSYGTQYYVPGLFFEPPYVGRLWENSPLDFKLLGNRLVHLSPESASAHAMALIKLTSQD